MKKLLLSIVSLLFLIPSVSHAFMDDWDQYDKLLLAGYSATWFVDYGQTREIAVNDSYYEKNPILGRYPSQEDVNVYFVGSYLLNLFVADTLDGWWRKGYLAAWLLCHLDAALHNERAGLSINFEF